MNKFITLIVAFFFAMISASAMAAPAKSLGHKSITRSAAMHAYGQMQSVPVSLARVNSELGVDIVYKELFVGAVAKEQRDGSCVWTVRVVSPTEQEVVHTANGELHRAQLIERTLNGSCNVSAIASLVKHKYGVVLSLS